MSERSTEFIDKQPRNADFRKEVLDGLSSSPKKIPPKFFYDDEGSRLFEKITETDEYYVTDAEEEILSTKGESISQIIGPGAYMIEYGSGNSTKTLTLISALDSPSAYALIDISADALIRSAERINDKFPGLKVYSICADYLRMGDIPAVDGVTRKVIVFFGSTIGNFEPHNASKFLDMCSHDMETGDGMLVGVDLKKDEEVLNRAYNDSEEYTARFNLNLLARMRRELNTDIDPDKFEHLAFYNADKGRIEMHLRSLADQDVSVEGKTFHFSKGETIHTENSYKYSAEDFERLVMTAGLKVRSLWKDSREYFGLFYLTK